MSLRRAFIVVAGAFSGYCFIRAGLKIEAKNKGGGS